MVACIFCAGCEMYVVPNCRDSSSKPLLIDEIVEEVGWLVKTPDKIACSVYLLASAAPMIPGTFRGEGAASKSASLGNTLFIAALCVINQGGVGMARNGARSTLFCGR